MSRLAAAFAFFAVLVLAAPAVSASLTVGDALPVRGAWPYAPQLHCEYLIDRPVKDERCNVEGPGSQINQVRVRVSGNAQVRVAVTDEGQAVPVSLAYFDCSQSCIHTLPKDHNSGRFDLLVFVTGGPNAVVSVNLEMGLRGVMV